MLTPEQKAALHRLDGQEGVLIALFEETRINLGMQIIETESHEKNKRDDLYNKVTTLNSVFEILKTNIRDYKNSL
ncbi:TPA: hypothetical protein SCS57_002039 [Enterobacter cloacae]|nr:hypothetical protein [Enterobacter cloacae]